MLRSKRICSCVIALVLLASLGPVPTFGGEPTGQVGASPEAVAASTPPEAPPAYAPDDSTSALPLEDSELAICQAETPGSVDLDLLQVRPGTDQGVLHGRPGGRTCRCSCGYPCKTDADCGPGGTCGAGITCC